MTTNESPDEVRARAALYALGALPADEAAIVERHLAAGDVRYREAVAAFRTVADDLAYAAAPQAPPPAARQRVLSRIAVEAAAVTEQDGLRFVRGAGVAWEPGVAPGIEFKRLHVDPASGRRTSLIRMAAGTVYPTHRHPAVEEVYLLAGDLMVHGVLMHAGDYCVAAPDTLHQGIVSPSGCVFVVSAAVNECL